MALISLSFMAVWTVLVIRLFAVRATLSDRTLVVYLALGALMALTAAPLAEKFIVPYPLSDYGYGYLGAVARVTVRHIVLLTPVLAYLFLRRMYRRVSVADAFCLAFAVGFGYELVGALLAASTAAESLRGMTLFPPWQFTWDSAQRFPIFGISGDFGIAGAPYAAGLVSLLLASLLRAGQRPRIAFALSAGVLVLVAAHEALWAQQIVTVGHRLPGEGIAWFLDLLLFHGKLLALLALAALIYFSVGELRWAADSIGVARPAKFALLDDAQLLLHALIRQGLRAYSRASAGRRLQNQIDIAKAELARAPEDRQLFESAQLLEIKLGQTEASPPADHENAPAPPLWEKRLIQAAWAALGLIVVLMPWLPPWLAPYLWKFPLLNFPLPLFPLTFLQLALIGVLLWWFIHVPATARQPWDPEAQFRHYGENAISFAALGAALLVLFHVPLDNFYPPYSAVTFLNRAGFPRFDAFQVPVLILLLAAVSSAPALRSAALWRSEASAQEQRATLVRKSIILTNAAICMWLSIKVYVPMLAAFQKALGPASFSIFGRFGNVVMALLTIVLVFGLSLGLGYLLRRVSQHVEAFLLATAKA